MIYEARDHFSSTLQQQLWRKPDPRIASQSAREERAPTRQKKKLHMRSSAYEEYKQCHGASTVFVMQ
jgi:hypothetical protein